MRLKRKKIIVKTTKDNYQYCFVGSGKNSSLWAAEWCILIQVGGFRAAERTDDNYVGSMYRGEDEGEAEENNPTPQSQNWVSPKQNYKSYEGAKFRMCFFFYYIEKRKV